MVSEREPIAVIGTGYVGLVTATGFAELGSEVWCVDVDAGKIAALRRGEIPIYEPGLAEAVARNRERMHFGTDLAPALEHARLLFVAVGTPPTYSGDADLSAVHAVVAAMPVSDRHALVMKSTVPVGTGAAIRRIFAEQGKSGFAYVSCPEFLKEGSALDDFLHPDRVVVGDDGDWAGDAVVELYAPLGAPLVRTDIPSAEMIKLAANAFLATKISFINEIANVCEETGADVLEVARGMGLDRRIGQHFLKPGIGFGGSCFDPRETVLVRHRGRTTLLSFERLWQRIAAERQESEEGLLEPHNLEVLSWVPGGEEPQFLPVMCLTRRVYEGEMVEVRTTMGRTVRTTPDHGWIVSDGHGGEPAFKLAGELTSEDWVPLAVGQGDGWDTTKAGSLLSAVEAAEISPDKLIVRPNRAAVGELVRVFLRAGAAVEGSTTGTSRSPRTELALDERFWRVVGLYIARGGASASALRWSFHPTGEERLLDEVASYWLAHNVRAVPSRAETGRILTVSSRPLTAWFTNVLGLGRNRHAQRLPDLIWEQPDRHRRALLSGLFEGAGSWSPIDGAISEPATGSDELADGVLRLLASVGIMAAREDHRRIWSSAAQQAERATYRRFGSAAGPAWVRVMSSGRHWYDGPVYSMEVPYAHTVVGSGGVTVSNCFPKDVSALKQLAGNSGYHFQLLTAVIEVNELQKRRVIAKLQKHLGSLVGKRVALLGLAFKANTDDMREASSLVLAARLQADGATVCAYDPVAEDEARKMMVGVQFADSALGALAGADACVIVTEWGEFRELDWEQAAARMRGRLVIDGRNFIDPERVAAAGFAYEGIGR